MVFMKRLYLYLIKRFIGPFFLTFFISIFVLLMQFLWRYLDELVGKGLETSIIVELMSYASLSLVPMALPLAVLIASVMTFGNLGERSELIAIKASGVSLLQIMKPLIYLTSLITIVAYLLANEVIPVTNAKFTALLWSIREQRPEMIIKEGAFSNEIDGYSIKVNRRDDDSELLYGIMIYDHTEDRGNVAVTIADSGYLRISDNKQYMILTLYNGESYNDEKPSGREKRTSHPFRREKFSKQQIVISVKDYSLERADESIFKDGYRMLKNAQIASVVDSLTKIYVETEKSTAFSGNYNSELNDKIKDHFRVDSLKVTDPADLKSVSVEFDQIFTSLDNDKKAMILEDAKRLAQSNQRNILQNEPILYNKIKWINRHIIEWHRKYTMSLACLIFFFIGAPLGAIIRKGGFGTPVVVSILMFIFYYIVSMIGENFAREGVWEPTLTMWFSTFFFLVISIFMTYQAVADTLLVSANVNSKILKRFKFLKSFLNSKEEPDQNETSFFDQ